VRRLTLGIIVLIPIAALVSAVWWVRANEAWHDKTLASAKAFYEKGDFESAQPLLAKLARRFPDEIEVQYLLGETSFDLNDRVMALTAFDSALRSGDNPKWRNSIRRLIHAGLLAQVAGPTALRRLPTLSPGGKAVVYEPAYGTARSILVPAIRSEETGGSQGTEQRGRTFAGATRFLFARNDEIVFRSSGSGVVREEGGRSSAVRIPARALTGTASEDGSKIVYVDVRDLPAEGSRLYSLTVCDVARGTSRSVYTSRAPIGLLWVSRDGARAAVVTKHALRYPAEAAAATGPKPVFVLLNLESGRTEARVAFDQGLMAGDFIAASSIAGKHPLFAGRFGADRQVRQVGHLAGGDVSLAIHSGQVIAATIGDKRTEISRFDAASGKETRLTSVSAPLFADVAFSKDGRICVYSALSSGGAGSKGANQVICLLETDTGRNFLLLTPKLGVYDDLCSIGLSDDGRIVMYCIGRGRVLVQEDWPTHGEYEIDTFDMTRTPPRRELSNQLHERLSRIIYSR
jgi:hypothetical protein